MKILNNKFIKENKINEALHGKDDIETFLKMAKDIGLKTLADLEVFLKNEKQPDDKDEWETMFRYRASLGNDFKIDSKANEAMEKGGKCVICGKEIKGYGNNPAPVEDSGRCCDDCNKRVVIPARIKSITKKRANEEFKKSSGAVEATEDPQVLPRFENKKKKVSESLGDEEDEMGYIVVFGDDPDNFNEVRDFSEVFDTEEEAVQFVKDELALSEYRFALIDEEEPSGSGRTFTVNPQGEVEEVTDNYWKYSYTDYEDVEDEEDEDNNDEYSLDRYRVIEIDTDDLKKYYDSLEEYCEATEDYDVLDSFKDKDKAIAYVDYLTSIDIPACAYDEVEKKVIYRNKIEECLHKHCHKKFKFDDEPYKAPFHGAEVEVEDKELEYDDEPSMNY